jgi:hypothetical protein
MFPQNFIRPMIVYVDPVIARLITCRALLTRQTSEGAASIVDLLYDGANVTCDTNIEPAAVNTLGLMAFRSSRYSTPLGSVTNRLSRHAIWRKCKFYTKRSPSSQCVKGHRSRLNSFVCITRIDLALYYHTACINITKGKSSFFHRAKRRVAKMDHQKYSSPLSYAVYTYQRRTSGKSSHQVIQSHQKPVK